MRPECRGRRVRRERDHDGRAPACGTARRGHDLRPDVRLDEHVDRAAAGEADVPRLLVADPVADDAADAGALARRDLLERGALDAAARHDPGQPAVGGHDEARAFRPRRRAEGPDDDRAAERGALRLPARTVSSSSRISSDPFACRRRSGTAPTGRRRAARAADWGGAPTRGSDGSRAAPPSRVRRTPRTRGRAASPAAGGRPGAAQAHPAEERPEPLERRDRSRRQEVVDRTGTRRPSRGNRLVTGRARERVEPDEPMTVAPEARRLRRARAPGRRGPSRRRRR